MKKITLLACIILLVIKANAQDSSAIINTSWIGYALDTSLTFQQITATCDSQFAAAGYPAYPSTQSSDDSAADIDGSSFYRYAIWKNFYATRLDFATGKPHSFAADGLSFLSGSSSSTNCAGTSALQSNPGWQFIGPQGTFAGTEETSSSPNTLHMHLGEVNGIIVNTATPTNIYATDEWGGLWETTNAPAPGGTASATSPTWVCRSDNLPAMSGIGVLKLCVDFSASPHALYCLLGEYNATYCLPELADKLNHTIGIFYSPDDGVTFNQLNTSIVPNLLNNPIISMQLWPGNTATEKYLFVLTEFEVYRVDITTPSSPVWDSMISAYTVVPADAPTSRFWGFGGLNFLPADPTVMYVSTNSNNGNSPYNATAELFRISNANTCTSCTLTGIPISQTDYLQGEANPFSSDPFGPWFTSYIPTATTSTVTPTPSWSWHNEISNYYVQCTPLPADYALGCYTCGVSSIQTNVAGSYFDNITYTISFTLTLPPSSEVDVVLKDASDASNISGTDWGYGITPTPSSVGAYSVNFGAGPGCYYYSTYTLTPTPGYYANFSATTQTVTVTNYPVTTTHFVDRLEFGAYQLDWYAGGNVTLSNVTIDEPYQNYIYSLTTSPTMPECLFCCTNIVNPLDSMRKIWDMGTSFPMVSMLMTYGDLGSGQSATSLQLSTTDTNLIYEYASQANTHEVNRQDITDPSSPVNTYDGTAAAALHVDGRAMFLMPNSAGTDEIYMGCDGGIAMGTFDASGYSGSWQSLNGTGLKTSWGFDVGSSEHTGMAGEAATDNGIFTATPANFSNWSLYIPGDGAQVKFGKRYATRNVAFIGWSSSGVFQSLGALYFGGTPAVADLPGATPNVPSLGKLVTTYNNEYFGTGGVGSIYDVTATLTGTETYSLSFTSLTTDASFTSTVSIAAVDPAGSPSFHPGAVQAIAPDLYDANYIAAYLQENEWDQGYFAICTNANSVTPTWSLISNDPGINPYATNWYSLICMVADPGSTVAAGKRLWVGASGYNNGVPGVDRVFQSTDGGTTWADISAGLPAGPVNALAYDEQSHYLFAGTDQGIYAINVDAGGTNSWQCYSLNLPNSFVTGLDINRCTGMIYASTYGRGAYEAALPPDPDSMGTGAGGLSDACNIYSVTATTTWIEDVDEMRSIYIPAGVTLTIQNCTINMGKGKSIMVAAGGQLVVDGATITNGCGTFWQGIQLMGSPSLPQTAANDGWATIKNNSVIANAVVGVTNYGGSGGVVQATNSDMIAPLSRGLSSYMSYFADYCPGSGFMGNWSCLGPFTNYYGAGVEQMQGRILSLWVNPLDSNTILAGADGGGLFKTTDGGKNWACITDNALIAGGVIGTGKIVIAK